jgi:3-oxoacyl-[acyl-carrier protein] reductase
VDLSLPESDSKRADLSLQAHRRLDVLVLCQGIVRYQRAEFEMPGFREVIEVNLMSLMRCASASFEALRQARGSLIVVSSTAAFHATRGNPAYAASKAGAVGLVRTLAQAWASEGVRVNGIAPGFVDTKLTKVTTANPKRLAAALERIPAQRLGQPEDMAGAALFLASPLAAYIYGQTLVVDGGLLL